MNDKKLQAKDFITIGIFTALLFVVEFACGLLGFIHPYIVASYVVMIPIVGSIPMMLFYTKIEKFGMLSIMSVCIIDLKVCYREADICQFVAKVAGNHFSKDDILNLVDCSGRDIIPAPNVN